MSFDLSTSNRGIVAGWRTHRARSVTLGVIVVVVLTAAGVLPAAAGPSVPPGSTTPDTTAPDTTTPDTTPDTTTPDTTTPATTVPGTGMSPAEVTEQAVRIVPESTDIVSVYDAGALDPATEAKAVAAAQAAGGTYTINHSASIGLVDVRRGDEVVQRPPSGYAYPMATTVLDRPAILAFMGISVAGALDADRIVMGELTASLRGAQAGDVVSLVPSWGGRVDFTIGAVVPDEVTGGTEILMTPDAALRLGLNRESSVVIWGFTSRAAIDQALVDQDLISTRTRIRRSWEPLDPDTTIGMARTKQLLGEFAYRVIDNQDGTVSVSIDAEWRAANLPPSSQLLDESVRIVARCHNVIQPALRAALAEVAANGLSWTINVYDANRAGGCYNPRFNRLTQNSSIGFLSRHTWAMAIDTNTIGSCQGCAPPDMDCRTVRIFRKHGFAWGGNFLTPDGMHYEFVGESRDQYAYPSRFCPNIVTDPARVDVTERATLFSEAGLTAE